MGAYPAKKMRGSSLAEVGAALAIIFPLLLVMLFGFIEATKLFMIKNGLAACARQAARSMSIAYADDPTIEYDRAMQDTQVFDNIRMDNIVNDSDQFDDAVFDTVSDPGSVTVTVKYLSNQYGLPTFPDHDFLGLGDSIELSNSSTYSLD